MLAAAASDAGADELLRRARSLEERVGRVELRRVFGPRLQVIVGCDSDPRGCVEERIYAEVATLDFLSSVRAVENDGFIDEEQPIGTIRVALDFSDAERQLLWSEIRGRLYRLSAEAFAEPLAGWGPSVSPFDKQTLGSAEIPTWACFESSDGTTVVRYEGGSAQRYSEPPTTACEQMRAAAEGFVPDVVQTLASPRRLLELVVEHDDVVRIDDHDPGALAERPDEVRLIKQKAASGASVESASELIDGGMGRATHMRNGWRFDALAAPAEMPIEALDRNAWLHAWTVTRIERELGPDPVERVVGSERLLAAFLATVPATPGDNASVPESDGVATIDRSAFLRLLAAELDRYSGCPLDRIEELASRPPVGLRSEGWLIVVCREGDEATYFVPPTQAFHRVTNAAFFCGALESRLR